MESDLFNINALSPYEKNPPSPLTLLGVGRIDTGHVPCHGREDEKLPCLLRSPKQVPGAKYFHLEELSNFPSSLKDLIYYCSESQSNVKYRDTVFYFVRF